MPIGKIYQQPTVGFVKKTSVQVEAPPKSPKHMRGMCDGIPVKEVPPPKPMRLRDLERLSLQDLVLARRQFRQDQLGIYEEWDHELKEVRMECARSDSYIDCSDIPPNWRIDVEPFKNPENLIFFVNKQVSVHCLKTNYREPIRVLEKISEECLDHHRAQNHVFYTTRDHQNINCLYEFSERKDFQFQKYKRDFVTSGKIACRHLVVHSLLAHQKKGDLTWKECRDIDTQKTIIGSRFCEEKYEKLASDVTIGSMFRHVFTMDQWGGLLHHLMDPKNTVLEDHEVNEQHYALTLHELHQTKRVHCVHVILKTKHDDNGKPTQYEVKLYDPNTTYNHLRYITTNIHDLKNLSIEDFKLQGYEAQFGLLRHVPSRWPEILNIDNHQHFYQFKYEFNDTKTELELKKCTKYPLRDFILQSYLADINAPPRTTEPNHGDS